MSLSSIMLAVTLILIGLAWLGWVAISVKVLGGFAFATGVIMILEGLNVVNLNSPFGKRNA